MGGPQKPENVYSSIFQLKIHLQKVSERLIFLVILSGKMKTKWKRWKNQQKKVESADILFSNENLNDVWYAHF